MLRHVSVPDLQSSITYKKEHLFKTTNSIKTHQNTSIKISVVPRFIHLPISSLLMHFPQEWRT
jgi:hypothetical protein